MDRSRDTIVETWLIRRAVALKCPTVASQALYTHQVETNFKLNLQSQFEGKDAYQALTSTQGRNEGGKGGTNSPGADSPPGGVEKSQ